MYILSDNSQLPCIPDELNCIYFHKIKHTTNLAELFTYKENGNIGKYELELINFLYTVKFASESQICMYMDMFDEFKGQKHMTTVHRLINKWILNRLYITDEDDCNNNEWPDDAFFVYCLCDGGARLLEKTRECTYLEWSNLDVRCASGSVARQLVATQLYLDLLKENKEFINYFCFGKKYSVGEDFFSLDFEFCLTVNEQKMFFTGLVFRKEDNLLYLRDKILQIDALFTTKAYKKYFSSSDVEPILFICADDEEHLKEITEELKITAFDRYRFILKDRLFSSSKPLKDSFMKYDLESDTYKNIRLSFLK